MSVAARCHKAQDFHMKVRMAGGCRKKIVQLKMTNYETYCFIFREWQTIKLLHPAPAS